MAKGNVDEVARYVKRGWNLNVRDPTGMTPLHYAAQEGHADVVKALIDSGADARPPRPTPLSPASRAFVNADG